MSICISKKGKTGKELQEEYLRSGGKVTKCDSLKIAIATDAVNESYDNGFQPPYLLSKKSTMDRFGLKKEEFFYLYNTEEINDSDVIVLIDIEGIVEFLNSDECNYIDGVHEEFRFIFNKLNKNKVIIVSDYEVVNYEEGVFIEDLGCKYVTLKKDKVKDLIKNNSLESVFK